MAREKAETVLVANESQKKILPDNWTSIPVLLVLLAFIFWLTICGANYPSRLLSWIFAQSGNILERLFDLISLPVWIEDCLLNGVYRTVSWVIAVMLPPMAIFFPLFALLEECGYLPRVAGRLDNCFKKAGSCGKHCLTTCMSLGCNAAGVTGCRMIESPRERLIAIITASFTPCNGRLPMLIAIVSIFFARDNSVFAALLLLLLLLISFTATLSASKILSCTILKGIPSSFQLELPPYHKPDIPAVIIHALRDRALFVLLRALIIAAPAGCIIWLLSHIAINGQMPIVSMTQLLEPAARPFGMDGIILLAFLLGWPANEIVIPLMLMLYLSTGSMVELESYATLHQILSANGWTWQTAASVLLFTLFHWPCSTTCLTIYKETGSTGWTLLAIVLPAVIGFLFCFVLQLFFQLAGV